MKTILIHGLGQTAGAWNKTAELLPQEDVLCPELSAFIGGGSYGRTILRIQPISGRTGSAAVPVRAVAGRGSGAELRGGPSRLGAGTGACGSSVPYAEGSAQIPGRGFPAHAGEVVRRLRAYQKADDIPHRRHGASGLHAVAGQNRMSRVNSLRRARQSQHQRRAGTGKYPPAGTANGHQRRRT